MKKLLAALLTCMICLLAVAALAEPLVTTRELNQAVLDQLVPHADQGKVTGHKVDLRKAGTDKRGFFFVLRSGRLLNRGNLIDIWGLPMEDGTIAVAHLRFKGETYIKVTSRLGDGLIPLLYEKADEDEFKAKWGKEKGYAHADPEPKPGNPSDPEKPGRKPERDTPTWVPSNPSISYPSNSTPGTIYY